MLAIAKPAYQAGVSTAWPQSQADSVDPRRRRLFFVDDDDLYRGIVKEELIEEGFHVLDFASGEEMVASLRIGADPDIVIIDWGVRGTGLDLVPTIHAVNESLPVVFLTGQASPVHEHLAFQRGAVDFIDKVRGTQILAARLRLIVSDKRQVEAPSQTFERGALVLRLGTARAYWKDSDVGLTISEFKIVQALAGRLGHVPYREIYDAMHYTGFMAGYGEEGYRANVRSSIKRIRKKFCLCDPTFDEITNYSGFGYLWGPRPK